MSLGTPIQAAWAAVVTFAYGCATLHTPAPAGPPTEHFDGSAYHNPEPVRTHGWREVWRWMRTREPAPWPAARDAPCAPPPPARVPRGQARITWVGHATVLVQTAGLNLLTDPIWSARASPVPFAGPRRVHPPGVCFEDLPPIHGVLLSHNHYDHLDVPTLRRLHRTHRPVVYAGPGHRRLLARAGVDGVHELDWWQHADLDADVRLTAVPARHWSARGLLDRDHALWAGFYLSAPGVSVYFAGDTGYGAHFAAIRDRLGPPALALLPIGAYLPRWFMRDVHLSPADAVRALEDLGARRALGIHHDTFRMADEAYGQAVAELNRARHAAGLAPERFVTLNPGAALRVSPARAAAGARRASTPAS